MGNITKWTNLTLQLTSPSKRKTLFSTIKLMTPKVGAMFGRLLGAASWGFTLYELYGYIFGSGSNVDSDGTVLVVLPDSVARALTLDTIDEALPPAFLKAAAKAQNDGSSRMSSFYLTAGTYLSSLPYLSGLMFTPERAEELLVAASDNLKKDKLIDEIPNLDDLKALYAEPILARRTDYIIYYLLIAASK